MTFTAPDLQLPAFLSDLRLPEFIDNVPLPPALAALPLLASLIMLAVCIRLAKSSARHKQAKVALAKQTASAVVAEQAALRQLRVNAHQLRSVALTLHGTAQHLATGGPPDALAIATAATAIFDISDFMHEFTTGVRSDVLIKDEVIGLGAVLDEMTTVVIRAAKPARRALHVAPGLSETIIRADRRALRHVLTRVLTIIVRRTHQDDVIAITMQSRSDGLALLIEGQPAATSDRAAVMRDEPDLRMNGLHLSLAEALMRAHGGSLEFMDRPDHRPSASILFPTSRITKVPVDAFPLHMKTARSQSTAMLPAGDDRASSVLVT